MKRIIQLLSRSNSKPVKSSADYFLRAKKTKITTICNFADDYYNDQRCIHLDK